MCTELLAISCRHRQDKVLFLLRACSKDESFSNLIPAQFEHVDRHINVEGYSFRINYDWKFMPISELSGYASHICRNCAFVTHCSVIIQYLVRIF